MDKQIVIEIDEEIYNYVKTRLMPKDRDEFVDEMIIAVVEGKPLETVTEFADRSKECGAKYGKLLKQETTQENLLRTMFNLEAENERLYDAFDKIAAEIETDTEKWWEDDECFAKLSDVLAIIDKYRKEQNDHNKV